MSAVPMTQELRGGRRLRDRFGDRLLLIVTSAAGLGAVVLIGFIAYRVIRGAHLALSTFGLPFVWHTAWDTNKNVFGAAPGLYGTAVTSLVETLAAIPSVVLGLWGILVLGPFLADHVEPWLHNSFGFLPIFSGTPQSSGIFVAGVILAIMVVPIVASVCRELFLSVPPELEEGALALGATRWEMVRGVVLSSSRPGIGAAVILGLGRALGEAIAVTQVIGAGWFIRSSLFAPGDTLASRIAGQYQGAVSKLQIASLFYLAAILLVIGLLTNLLAQIVVKRFAFQRTGGS